MKKETKKTYDELRRLLMDQRAKSNIKKGYAYEFELTEEEEFNIIGRIEGRDSSFTIYALYPWEGHIFALTSDGMDVPLKEYVSDDILIKLYESIKNRV